MMFARPTFAAAGIALAAATCLAQPDPVARQKLEKCVDTIKQLNSFSYSMKHKSEGLFGLEQRADTQVLMLRSPANPARWLVHWSGKIKAAGEEETDMLASLDQSTGFMVWIEHAQKEWVKKQEREFRNGPMDRKAFAWVAAIADPEPLKDQVEAPEIIPEADATVDGVLCDVIMVKPEKGQPRRWAIGKEDHLPRRLEWVFEGSGLSGRWLFDMSAVTANPPLTPEQFDIPVPEGYRKTEPPPPPVYVPPPPGSTGSSATNPDSRPAPATQVKNIGAAVGDLAPDFDLVKGDVDGTGNAERIRLSSLRGHVVVLDFWGSWSPKSKAAAPEMKALVEKYTGKPVRVIGMTLRERDKAKPIAFMKDHGYPWTILLDADETAKQYKVRIYPTYFVINAGGEIVHIESNFEKEKTMGALADAIDRALATAPTPAGTPPATAPASDDGG